jgi:hypothetical protein
MRCLIAVVIIAIVTAAIAVVLSIPMLTGFRYFPGASAMAELSLRQR